MKLEKALILAGAVALFVAVRPDVGTRLAAATPLGPRVAIKNGDAVTGGYSFVTLGRNLKIRGDVLDVVPTVPYRIYDALLTKNDDGTFTLPRTSTNVVVYVNGMRVHAGVDWTWDSNNLKVTPIGGSGSFDDSSATVTADYDTGALP